MRRAWFLIKLLLLFAGVALIVRADLASRKVKLRLRPTSSELADVLPESDLTTFREDPIPHYPGVVTDEGVSRRAAAFSTAQIKPRVKGFVDEVNVLVSMDEQGQIRGTKILSHRETPYYMKMILDAGLLEEFLNRNIKDGFEDIEAVTGATITAEAIIKDVEAASKTAAVKLYNIEVKGEPLPALKSALLDAKFILLLVVLVAGLLARYIRIPRFGREVVYVLSIVTVGFYLNTPYALVHTFQFASLKWPGVSNLGLIVLGIYILATTLFSGPLYCGYICPFGGMQDILYRISPRGWRWEVSPRVLRIARELRYLILFICVAGYFGLGISAFSEVEPFSHLFALTRSFIPWLLIIAVLFTSLFVRRFWCRFFCPTGACLVMLSAHRRFFKHIERGLTKSEIDPGSEDDGQGSAEKVSS